MIRVLIGRTNKRPLGATALEAAHQQVKGVNARGLAAKSTGSKRSGRRTKRIEEKVEWRTSFDLKPIEMSTVEPKCMDSMVKRKELRVAAAKAPAPSVKTLDTSPRKTEQNTSPNAVETLGTLPRKTEQKTSPNAVKKKGRKVRLGKPRKRISASSASPASGKKVKAKLLDSESSLEPSLGQFFDNEEKDLQQKKNPRKRAPGGRRTVDDHVQKVSDAIEVLRLDAKKQDLRAARESSAALMMVLRQLFAKVDEETFEFDSHQVGKLDFVWKVLRQSRHNPEAKEDLEAILCNFPVRTVFENQLNMSKWGLAQDTLEIVETYISGSKMEPPEFVQDLEFMLSRAVKVGRAPPVPKDTLSLSMQLMEILRLAGQNRAASINRSREAHKYYQVMVLCSRQFDTHGDRTLLVKILELHKELRSKGCKPTISMWCCVITTYARLDRLDLAFRTLETLQRELVPPHPFIGQAMVQACAKCGDMEKAEQILDNMRHGADWAPGAVYEPSVAKKIWRSMFGEQRDADPQMYTDPQGTADSADGEAERPRAALPVWPPPSVQAYNELLRAYAATDNVDNVHALYTDMKSRGVKADQITIRILAEAFAESSYGYDLLRLEQPDLLPPIDLYSKHLKHLQHNSIFSAKPGIAIASERILDLHGFTRGEAKILVKAHLEAIMNGLQVQEESRKKAGLPPFPYKDKSGLDTCQNFTLITGKGAGGAKSGRKGPVLRGQIELFLIKSKIPYTVPKGNQGIIIIRLEALQEYMRQRKTAKISTLSPPVAVGIGAFASLPVGLIFSGHLFSR
mmetsp:Transcript_10334/g.19017  ORF Transcript_10334/g.19017 Transcript_10334/m.19017 type:complete len:797 (+) Transcript_10334:250-2640(+)